jgi:hypothetical protein
MSHSAARSSDLRLPLRTPHRSKERDCASAAGRGNHGRRAPAQVVGAGEGGDRRREPGRGRRPSVRSRLRSVGGASRCGDPASVRGCAGAGRNALKPPARSSVRMTLRNDDEVLGHEPHFRDARDRVRSTFDSGKIAAARRTDVEGQERTHISPVQAVYQLQFSCWGCTVQLTRD